MTEFAYVEGEGIVTADGRFYSEAQIRAVFDLGERLLKWFNSLSPELQEEMRQAAIEQQRQEAMRRGS